MQTLEAIDYLSGIGPEIVRYSCDSCGGNFTGHDISRLDEDGRVYAHLCRSCWDMEMEWRLERGFDTQHFHSLEACNG